MWLRSCLRFFILICPIAGFASGATLTGKLGMWSFETENVRGRAESTSGFGAYAVELGYGLSEKWMAVAGANMLLSDGISGSTGFGFDLGAKYYPLTSATSVETQTESTYVKVHEPFRPYVGLFLRQRDFNLALQSGYVGPGVSLGFDYNYSRQWFFNFEFRYDSLNGSGEGTATQTNILFGVGIEI